MVTLKEYFGHITLADVSMDHARNAEELLRKINILRAVYGKPFIVTSGYRTLQDHLRIYRSKKVPDHLIPMKSKHLSGQAIDISDPNGEIAKWLKENDSERMKAVDLYGEEGTQGWVHLQNIPPKSQKRWFLP